MTFMTRQLAICLAALLPGLAVHAQDETLPAEEEEAPDTSQEVEVSEDNYRRFMELKDARIERDAFPVNAYTPQAQLLKMGELPEESQKHLRNQLRQIIIENDGWSPEDANSLYPYTPSAAADSDQELRRQEQAAWGELVENYHQREAMIYANADRSQAATAAGMPGAMQEPGAEDGTSGGTGGESDQPGEEDGEEQNGDEAQDAAKMASGPSGGGAPGSPGSEPAGAEGVTQSALQYLQEKGIAQAGSNGGAQGGGKEVAPGGGEQSAAQAAAQQASAEGAQPAAEQQAAEQQAAAGQESAEQQATAEQQAAESQAVAQNQDDSDQDESEASQESERQAINVDYTSPGYIAIRDLEKIGEEDAENPEEDESP
jgi:hypothetical protein